MTGLPAPIRILVVDDHLVVREGFKALLGLDPAFSVVGEAGSGAEAVSAFRSLDPDVTLLDLHLPDMGGAEVIGELRAYRRRASIVVVTSFERGGDVKACLDAGALGYVLKDARREELFEAIRSAAKGIPFVSSRAVAHLVEVSRSERLTAREVDVLELLVEGRSNREIGRKLDCTVGTVKSHVHAILAKLGVESRSAAVSAATRLGLVRSGPGDR